MGCAAADELYLYRGAGAWRCVFTRPEHVSLAGSRLGIVFTLETAIDLYGRLACTPRIGGHLYGYASADVEGVAEGFRRVQDVS